MSIPSFYLTTRSVRRTRQGINSMSARAALDTPWRGAEAVLGQKITYIRLQEKPIHQPNFTFISTKNRLYFP